jgi:hypothetical protein
MKYRKLVPAALAIASLACVATLNLADAANSPGEADISARSSASQPVRLAENVATKKTKRKKIEQPQTNWLNPQPEPPMSGKKPIQGGNWLNPQPEPPRPVTTKKQQ